MRNVILVLKYEIQSTLSKRSFWIMTFVFPAFILLLNVGTQYLANSTLSKSSDILPESNASGEAGQAIGYVDQSGLIQKFPPDIPAGLLKAYPDEASALADLKAGKISDYMLVPPDFLKTRKLVEVQANLSPMGNTKDNLFQYLIIYNLTGNTSLTAALVSPLRSVLTHNLAPQTTGNSASPLASIVPYATLFIFFFLITTSSSLMLQSVTREKENRIIEVLLVSVNPRHLMLGKVLGLAAVALLQLALWMGGAVLFLNRGQQLLGAVSSFQLPPGFLIYALLFFGLGYLVYASLMGMVGALSPTAREGGQFTFIFMLPLMLPLFFNFAFIDAPDGLLPVVLSLFPLSAPSAMMTRLATGNVPFWQLALSIALLVLTAYFAVTLSARFFKADNLLSGAAFKWDRFLKQLHS